MGAGIDPGANDRAKLLLCARRRTPACARMPCPADEMVFSHMVSNGSKRPIAIPFAVLDLRANLTQRSSLPTHRCGCERPMWIARDAGDSRRASFDIGGAMAGRAGKPRHAMPFAREHGRLVRTHRISLGRAASRRMAIHASRAGDDLPCLIEQGDRARRGIGNAIEAGRVAQFRWGLALRRAGFGPSARGNRTDEDCPSRHKQQRCGIWATHPDHAR